MAKLLIYQGDVLEREVELGERNARIGRGVDNDIVLADPTKSVSRRHAEVRFEQGKYIVVDRESQNGVWLAGRRVPETTLEPGVPVLLGSFKLVLKDERPPAAPADGATILLAASPSDATVFIARPTSTSPPPTPNAQPQKRALEADVKPEARPAAVPEMKAEPKPAAVPEMKAEPKPAAVPEMKAEPKPVAVPEMKAQPKLAPVPEARPKPSPPPPPAAAPKPEPPPPSPSIATAPASPTGKRISKGLLFGGVAALVAMMTAAVFWTPLATQLTNWRRTKPAPSPAAPSPVTPAPVARPAPAVNPPAAASPSPAPRPGAARVARGASTPANAGPTVPTPAAAPRLPKVAPVKPVPTPEQKPAAGATGSVEKPPTLDLAGTFEQARSATIKGDYPAAIAGFESILKVDPNYPNAANLLGVARGGAKNASQLAVDSGNKAEMSGDYAGAAKEYDRALQLDPQSTAAPDAIRRLKARMQLEGEATITQATQYDALGRKQDAIAKYEKALQLLPPDHASVKTARERLAALKGGN